MTIGLAWLAGAASFLSPCVLALVPAYVAYLGGRASRTALGAQRRRWEIFGHGLAFVVGFSLVFVGLGAAASVIGRLLLDLHQWIARLGGLVVIVFGLHTMGLISLPFLDFDTRRLGLPDANLGYLSSMLMGVFFSAGWSPCIGPVLGAVLTLALVSASLGRGVLLLGAYSLGLAIPFLIAAFAIERVSDGLHRNARLLRYSSWVTGALLVVIGVMLFFGLFQQVAGLGYLIHIGL